MDFLTEVKVGIRPIERFIEVIGEAQVGEAMRVAQALKQRMGEHVIWNVNSTAVGGGVAEMLQPLLGYARGIGVDTPLARDPRQHRLLPSHQAHAPRVARRARGWLRIGG